MSYHNTGYARNKSLTVTKGNYSHTYNLTDGFSPTAGKTYQSINDTALARLSQENYESRLQDFVDYVYSLETGLRDDCPNMIVGAQVYNTTLCPVVTPD